MGKYAPLRDFLISREEDYVPMSFAEIERVLGTRLPASKRYPAWWSNNPSNNPMTREWLEAGFETESVNTGSEKLVFRRVRKGQSAAEGTGGSASRGISQGARRSPSGRGFREKQTGFRPDLDAGKEDYIVPPEGADPLFGCMEGTLTLLPDVDYTAPADPDWGKLYDD